MPTEDAAPTRFDLTLKKSPASAFDARFILSASSPDRVKDTIDSDAYLPHVGKKLIALWQHDRDAVLGFWQNLKVEKGALIGDLKIAGTRLGDMVKVLLSEGVPLGASIGFRGKGEPNDFGGVHFSAIDLLETSLVSVPAHPRAQQIAKQFGIPLTNAAGQLPARGSASTTSTSAVAARTAHRSHIMPKTISELVVDAQATQTTLVDKLTTETQALGALEIGTDEHTTQKAVVDQVQIDLDKTDGTLASLKAAEARLARGAVAVRDVPAIIEHRSASKDTDNLLGKMALCVFESRVKGMDIDQVAAMRFPNSQAVDTLIKAAQNPAMSNVAGYAQELTRQTYGQFMDLLRSVAVLPQCTPAGNSHSFDGSNMIYVPTRLGGDVRGSFRAEGAPIPVRGLTFSHIQLTPKNMGVIVTATMEMLRRSSIDLAAYLQNAIIYDTGRALDALFISNTAGSVITPAGVRNGLTVADTRASTGATAAQITNDIKVMLKALTANDMGAPATTKWLMHPSNLVAVSMLLTATGSKQFPEAESGRLAGYPVVTSTRLDPTIVLLIDFDNYTFALGSPAFRASEEATIHEEDTAPLPIGAPGAPATVAAPARSLLQTNSWALRMMLDADWAKLRPIGPVQELTAVAW